MAILLGLMHYSKYFVKWIEEENESRLKDGNRNWGCGITVVAVTIAVTTEPIAVTTEPIAVASNVTSIAVMATYCSNNSSYVSVSIRYMSLLHTVLILYLYLNKIGYTVI